MIRGIVKPGMYQDSVNLMLLSGSLSRMEGVNAVSVMMGTPANKELFRAANLYDPAFDAAGPNDMCLAVDAVSEAAALDVIREAERFTASGAAASASERTAIRTWDAALEHLPDANLALISVPGRYAAHEARRALDRGLSVFLFSDNVSLEDEVDLKRTAHRKGLLVMGPDCGTACLAGVPLAFSNVVRRGRIGLAAASGTGLQEVMVGIHRLGGGVSQAFGLGGRDLSEAVGGASALDAVRVLAEDPATGVLVFVSKPPAPAVRDRVLEALAEAGKPVVAVFMGLPADLPLGRIRFAATLDQAARLAVEEERRLEKGDPDRLFPQLRAMKAAGQYAVQGLFSGGTLAAEAAMILRRELGCNDDGPHTEGRLLSSGGHSVIDLGDDVYTVGRPHPMIDARTRMELIEKAAEDPYTAVILFDVVLGWGGSMDMAGSLVPALRTARGKARAAGRDLVFIASICGTDEDPQNYDAQAAALTEAGVYVASSNAAAAELAAATVRPPARRTPAEPAPEGVRSLLHGLRVVNIGLSGFVRPILEHGGRAVQYDWVPPAGGDRRLADLLAKLQ